MELLLGRRPKKKVVDPNVDSMLTVVSKGIAVGSSAQGTVGGVVQNNPTSGMALGYYYGVLYVLKSDGLWMIDINTMTSKGKMANVAGRTVPLNTSSFCYKGVLYYGQGRGKTGIIECIDLRTGVYRQFPGLAYNYGGIYVDDNYLYSLANVYTSTGFSTNAIRRFPLNGTSWEDVICTGAFTHGVSGADTTLVGDTVYITGGGSIVNSSDMDGSSYRDMQCVNLKTKAISQITLPSPGFQTYDMASCVWKDKVYAVGPSGQIVNIYDLKAGTASSTSGPLTTYHCPCLRVGDIFFYLINYG